MQFNIKNQNDLLGVTPCEKCKGSARPNGLSGWSFPLYLFTEKRKKDAVPIPNAAEAYLVQRGHPEELRFSMMPRRVDRHRVIILLISSAHASRRLPLVAPQHDPALYITQYEVIMRAILDGTVRMDSVSRGEPV